MPKPFVFISNHHSDQQFADGFAERLETAGIRYFQFKESIEWGEDIPDRIHEALQMATHLVVFISPGSEESLWVAYEIGYARGRKIHVLPYKVHPEMKLPGFIATKKYLRHGADSDEAKWIAGLKESSGLVLGVQGLKILSAKYQARGRTRDVTDDVIRQLSEEGNVHCSFASDPAPYTPKKLVLKFEYEGEKKTITVPEGTLLSVEQLTESSPSV